MPRSWIILLNFCRLGLASLILLVCAGGAKQKTKKAHPVRLMCACAQLSASVVCLVVRPLLVALVCLCYALACVLACPVAPRVLTTVVV